MFFLCILIIREDFRLNHLVLFPHQDFLYQCGTAQLVLQFLRRHILAVGKDDQVLPASRDVDEIILIHVPQVPGLQPSVLQGFGGLLRHLIIPLHHAGAPDPDFLIHHLGLTVGKQLAHRPLFVLPLQVGADDRRTLRHAIPLKDGDAILLELIHIIRVQVSAAAAYDPQVSAKRGLCHHFLWDKAAGVLELAVDGFNHKGNQEHDFRFEQLHIPLHMHDGIIDADYKADVKSLDDVHGQAVHMVNGQECHGNGPGRNLHIQAHRIVHQVPVAQHDPLTLAGGS